MPSAFAQYQQGPSHYMQQMHDQQQYGQRFQQINEERTGSFDTQHDDLIHDAQFDYYGRRLATASSDRTVKVWFVEPGHEPTLQATLSGHEGPVWQVAWAHPHFGTLLATCSFDGHVIIWQEHHATVEPTSSFGMKNQTTQPSNQNQQWQKIKVHEVLEGSSVNSISWAPFEHGLRLACASSDGRVSVLTCKLDNLQSGWESIEFHAHSGGCNAVSWAPSMNPNILSPTDLSKHSKLATAGCDNLVRVWIWNNSEKSFTPEGSPLEGHSDWVRDVAFNPVDSAVLASCGQDHTVRIWRESSGKYSNQLLSKDSFADSLWRLSWSTGGTQLAVTGGDNKVTLWREDGTGSWEMSCTVDH